MRIGCERTAETRLSLRVVAHGRNSTFSALAAGAKLSFSLDKVITHSSAGPVLPCLPRGRFRVQILILHQHSIPLSVFSKLVYHTITALYRSKRDGTIRKRIKTAQKSCSGTIVMYRNGVTPPQCGKYLPYQQCFGVFRSAFWENTDTFVPHRRLWCLTVLYFFYLLSLTLSLSLPEGCQFILSRFLLKIVAKQMPSGRLRCFCFIEPRFKVLLRRKRRKIQRCWRQYT